MSASLLDAALAYAQRGWHVFPCWHVVNGQCACSAGAACKSPGKHPRTASGFKEATTDAAKIRVWWALWPSANVAVATGSVSGVDVIDIDPRHGGDVAFEELCGILGNPPSTLTSITPSKGRHLWFRHSDGLKSDQNVPGPGIDLRADGGYVVASPSKGASGDYGWDSVSGEPDEPVADLPPKWVDALRKDKAVRRGDVPGPLGTSVVEGNRNSTLASLAGTMRRRGMEAAEIEAALQIFNANRCSPPLSEREVATVVHSVCKYPPTSTPVVGPQPSAPVMAAGTDASDASDAFIGLPTFPMDALSPTAARLARHFAAAVEAQPDLVVPAMLAALSTALGPEWKVGAKSFIRAALLWFVLVASSGMSKTPATKPVLAPLHAEDRRLGETYKAAHRAYARDLRDWNRAKKGDTGEKPEEPPRPRAAITDVTPEGVVAALAASPKGLLVHSDEVAQLLNSLDTYHAKPGRGRATFLSLWSGTRIAEARKTAKESEADDPFAVIFGGIQQAVLCRLQLEDGDGLCARFLFSVVRGKPGGLGQNISPGAIDLWNRFIALAQGHRVKSVQFFDVAGQELLDQKLRVWKQRAADLDDAGSGLLASMYGKAGDHCVRLTAVLHGMDAIEASLALDTEAPPPLEARQVPCATVERAVRLVEYYLKHGSAVAKLVVARPQDPNALANVDREVVQHLRTLVPEGREVTDTPKGWSNRLSNCGLKLTPAKVGRAFVRIEAAPASDVQVQRQPRGDKREWRVNRRPPPSDASEATGVLGGPTPAGPVGAAPSVGSDGHGSAVAERQPTQPEVAAPASADPPDRPSADASVASDANPHDQYGDAVEPPPGHDDAVEHTANLQAERLAEILEFEREADSPPPPRVPPDDEAGRPMGVQARLPMDRPVVPAPAPAEPPPPQPRMTLARAKAVLRHVIIGGLLKSDEAEAFAEVERRSDRATAEQIAAAAHAEREAGRGT